jgi:hypothetical protein
MAGEVSMPALKEWSAVVHALRQGRQTLLLRKGGIREKRFRLPESGDGTAAGPPFLLFPTVAHAHAARVRPEFRDLLAVGARDVDEDGVVVRSAARLVAAIEVRRPDRVEELEPWHIWTSESVRADRLDFRPRHLLAALVVEVLPIDPVRIPRRPEYAGCRSWVDVPSSSGVEAPARPGDELLDLAERVRGLVG